MGTNVLQGAPESVKALAKYLKANVIPLLPYRVMKNTQTPDGDMIDYYMVLFIPLYKDALFAPLAYSLNQQSSAPTLPAFVDMVIKMVKDNAKPTPAADWPMGDPKMKAIVDDMKKAETTIQADGETFPNPAYWLYKYIYGEPKAGGGAAPPVSSTSRTSPNANGGNVGTGPKCTPSLQQVPGGITETRCFN